jgi:hypothetical protein
LINQVLKLAPSILKVGCYKNLQQASKLGFLVLAFKGNGMAKEIITRVKLFGDVETTISLNEFITISFKTMHGVKQGWPLARYFYS